MILLAGKALGKLLNLSVTVFSLNPSFIHEFMAKSWTACLVPSPVFNPGEIKNKMLSHPVTMELAL